MPGQDELNPILETEHGNDPNQKLGKLILPLRPPSQPQPPVGINDPAPQPTAMSTPAPQPASNAALPSGGVPADTGSSIPTLDPATIASLKKQLQSPELQNIIANIQPPPQENQSSAETGATFQLSPPLPPLTLGLDAENQAQRQLEDARRGITDRVQGFIDAGNRDVHSSVLKGSSNAAIYDGDSYATGIEKTNRLFQSIQSVGYTKAQQAQASANLSIKQTSDPYLRPTNDPPQAIRQNTQASPHSTGNPGTDAAISLFNEARQLGVATFAGAGNKSSAQDIFNQASQLGTHSGTVTNIGQGTGKFDTSKPADKGNTFVDALGTGYHLAQGGLKNVTNFFTGLGQGLEKPFRSANYNDSQDYDPFYGVKDLAVIAHTNPLKLVFAPAILLSEGKYGQAGNGLLGGTMYVLGLPINIAGASVTTWYQAATGQNFFQAAKNNIVQVAKGGNYSFVQPPSKDRPLGIVPTGSIPSDPNELKKRSILFSNPVGSTIVDWVSGGKQISPESRRILRGVEVVTGLVADTVGGGAVDASIHPIKLTIGKAINPKTWVRTAASTDAEVGASEVGINHPSPKPNPLGGEIVGAKLKARPITEIPPNAVSRIEPPPSTGSSIPTPDKSTAPNVGGLEPGVTPSTTQETTPKLTVIPGDTQEAVRKAEYDNRMPYSRVLKDGSIEHSAVPFNSNEYKATNSVKDWNERASSATDYSAYGKTHSEREAAQATEEAKSTVSKGYVDPKTAPVEVALSISDHSPGTTVDAAPLKQVYRSIEDRTALAMTNGDAQPGRGFKPLPESRISILRTESPAHDVTYAPYGQPINDTAARVEINSHYPVADVVVPKEPTQLVQEIGVAHRIATDPNVSEEVRAQAAHTGDIHSDALVQHEGSLSPSQAAAYNDSFPKSLAVTSEEGRAQLARYLQTHTAYSDASRAAQELRLDTIKIGQASENNLAEHIDPTKDVGRVPLQRNPTRLLIDPQPTAPPHSDPDFINGLNDKTYYHGTKVVDHDLNGSDPHHGGSRNELGTGHYLTDSYEEAEHSAKASVNANLPPLAGRQFDPHPQGEVHQVKVGINNALDAKQSLPADAAQAVINSAKDAGFTVGEQKALETHLKANPSIADIYSQVEQSLGAVEHQTQEEKLLTFQRQVSKRLAAQGYDAIYHQDGKSTLINVLNPEKITSQRKVKAVGSDSTIEHAVNSYNVASRAWERFPEHTSVETRAREAGATLQSRLLQQAQENYHEASERATVLAHNTMEEERKLRNISKADNMRRQMEIDENNHAKNETQAKHLNRPDDTWCG